MRKLERGGWFKLNKGVYIHTRGGVSVRILGREQTLIVLSVRKMPGGKRDIGGWIAETLFSL